MVKIISGAFVVVSLSGFMSTAIAAENTKNLQVTVSDNGSVSQSFELPGSSKFDAKCMDSAERTTVLIEKNGSVTATCKTSKVSVNFEPSKLAVVGDKVVILK